MVSLALGNIPGVELPGQLHFGFGALKKLRDLWGLTVLRRVENSDIRALSPLLRAALRMFYALQRKEGREFPRCCSQNSPGPEDLELTFMWPYNLDISY